ARKADRPIRVVFPGSRLEYGRPAVLPAAESDPMHPLSPYGVNKLACELYLELYSRLHGISYAVGRLTNPYGPSVGGASTEYNVFNRLIAIAASGGDITLYGDGKQLRDYVFVDDAVKALALLAACQANITVNVGSGIGVTLRNATETIVRVVGRGQVVYVPWPADAQRVETGDFVADITGMRALGWEPSTALEDGIRRTLTEGMLTP
ncbi:MAG TPA: NAD-dependent epimerase/dehydratase family protein, partial [Candidatus Baltobacteraceae bacterium]